MKNKAKLIIFIIFLGVLIIRPVYHLYVNSTYSLTPISNEDFLKLENNTNDSWIIFGRPTCNECAVFLPKLETVAKNNKIKIMYYNIDKERKNSEDKMKDTLERYDVTVVPTLIHIKNDKVVKTLIGDQSIKSLQTTFFD